MDNVGTYDFGVEAHAGSAYGCYAGAAGTVFLRPAGAATGTLVIDNAERCTQVPAGNRNVADRIAA